MNLTFVWFIIRNVSCHSIISVWVQPGSFAKILKIDEVYFVHQHVFGLFVSVTSFPFLATLCSIVFFFFFVLFKKLSRERGPQQRHYSSIKISLTFHFYNKVKPQDTWVCSVPCKPKAKVKSAWCLWCAVTVCGAELNDGDTQDKKIYLFNFLKSRDSIWGFTIVLF